MVATWVKYYNTVLLGTKVAKVTRMLVPIVRHRGVANSELIWAFRTNIASAWKRKSRLRRWSPFLAQARVLRPINYYHANTQSFRQKVISSTIDEPDFLMREFK